jgi:hypothetical protein
MLEVIEVVRELVGCTGSTGRVSALDLRPAGDSGLDQQAACPKWHFALEELEELGALRSGADDAHLISQYVPELGKLIQSCRAQESPDSGDPAVILGCPDRLTVFSAIDHRSKLDQLEEPPCFTDALLAEEDRPSTARAAR